MGVARILAVGTDLNLLQTRALVMQRTGAEVSVAKPEAGLVLLSEVSFDALVLCHSLDQSALERLTTAARSSSTRVKVLLLISLCTGTQPCVEADARYAAELGPQDFLVVLRNLLQGAPVEEAGRRHLPPIAPSDPAWVTSSFSPGTETLKVRGLSHGYLLRGEEADGGPHAARSRTQR